MKYIFRLIPIVVFVVLFVILWKGLGRDPQLLPSALINKSMPDFSLPTLADSEKKISPSDLRGKAHIINVWASWCVACSEENAFLINLKKQGVSIIGLNYKDAPEAAQQWLTQWGDPYELVITDFDGRVGIDFGVYGVPETYLVNKRGVILKRFVGVLNQVNWSQELAAEYKKAEAE
jgi:cytochrome c biogenesis protein CcmG/thiol:disulfide interchange protein DsbE